MVDIARPVRTDPGPYDTPRRGVIVLLTGGRDSAPDTAVGLSEGDTELVRLMVGHDGPADVASLLSAAELHGFAVLFRTDLPRVD